MMTWFYELRGQRQGPVDPAALQALVDAGVIQPRTLVWTSGMADWTPAAETEFPARLPAAPVIDGEPLVAQPVEAAIQAPSRPAADHGHGREAAAAPVGRTSRYYGLSWSAKLLEIAVWSAIAATGLYLIFAALFRASLQGGPITDPARTAFYTSFENVVLIAVALASLAAGILYFVWLWRVSANARVRAAASGTFAPWLAVLSYFIPLANLIMPIIGMRRLITASGGPGFRVPQALILTWWLTFIAGFVTDAASASMIDTAARAADPIGALRDAMLLGMISAALQITALYSGLTLIRTVTALQKDWSRS